MRRSILFLSAAASMVLGAAQAGAAAQADAAPAPELAFPAKVAPGDTPFDALDRNGESIRLRFRRALSGNPALG